MVEDGCLNLKFLFKKNCRKKRQDEYFLNFNKPNTTHKTVPLTPATQSNREISPTRQILFGEDDPDEEEFLKEIFSALDPNLTLLFYNSGKKLLASIEKIPDEDLPELIVLDYNMPELNGAEILKELKRNQRYESIPKIIWSTSGSEHYKNLCLDSGAQEYVIKPSSIGELETVARHLLSYCST